MPMGSEDCRWGRLREHEAWARVSAGTEIAKGGEDHQSADGSLSN